MNLKDSINDIKDILTLASEKERAKRKSAEETPARKANYSQGVDIQHEVASKKNASNQGLAVATSLSKVLNDFGNAASDLFSPNSTLSNKAKNAKESILYKLRDYYKNFSTPSSTDDQNLVWSDFKIRNNNDNTEKNVSVAYDNGKIGAIKTYDIVEAPDGGTYITNAKDYIGPDDIMTFFVKEYNPNKKNFTVYKDDAEDEYSKLVYYDRDLLNENGFDPAVIFGEGNGSAYSVSMKKGEGDIYPSIKEALEARTRGVYKDKEGNTKTLRPGSLRQVLLEENGLNAAGNGNLEPIDQFPEEPKLDKESMVELDPKGARLPGTWPNTETTRDENVINGFLDMAKDWIWEDDPMKRVALFGEWSKKYGKTKDFGISKINSPDGWEPITNALLNLTTMNGTTDVPGRSDPYAGKSEVWKALYRLDFVTKVINALGGGPKSKLPRGENFA